MSARVQPGSPPASALNIFDRIGQQLQSEFEKARSVVTTALSLAQDFIGPPPHHNMRSHVFTPGRCDGGSLAYQGDIPVLSLDSDDPFIVGKAQGYLCGEAIHDLVQRFTTAIHTFDRQPRASQLPKTIAAIRRVVPPEFLREMEGLVAGHNQWSLEHHAACFDTTVDDILLFHILPESCHFDPGDFEKKKALRARIVRGVACSAVIEKDPKRGIVFARNMDWPSLRMAGSHSLVVHRKHMNGLLDTLEVSLPGFIGTMTGMNSRGLSMAMNVCSGKTQTVENLPSSLFNRACLERCATVEKVRAYVKSHEPLGPYHLSIADKKEACSIHFFQSSTGRHVIRRFKERPLVTLNCRYSPRPTAPMQWSEGRQQKINEFLKNRQGRSLEDVLSIDPINNSMTVHRVVMEPKTRTMRVAFDDAFAGTQPLQPVVVFAARKK